VAGLKQKNCKNREKIAKNARKLLQKTDKQCQNRQIVENGVDQVDLGGVPETKKQKNGVFFSFFARDLHIFAPFSSFNAIAPSIFFLSFHFRKCQLHPDQPGLRSFRQFVCFGNNVLCILATIF
jgi:hypothetical protein